MMVVILFDRPLDPICFVFEHQERRSDRFSNHAWLWQPTVPYTHDKEVQHSIDEGSSFDGNVRYWSPQRRVALQFSAYFNRTGGHIIDFAKNDVQLAACLVCIHINVNVLTQ